MRKLHVEQDLDELRRATQALAVIGAWSAQGAFAALADGAPRRLDELPGSPRAIALTAPLLIHVGVLATDGERVLLTQHARALLESGAFTLGGAAGPLADLSRLDEVIQRGEPVRATEGGVVAQDRDAARHFMDHLYRRSGESAEETARFMLPNLPPNARVLDLGGGHGRYGGRLSELRMRVTLFDVPVCVELARERYADRLEYIAGDFMTDSLGGPYDAVLLSNIVHGMSRSQNAALLARVRAALAPGGLLLVKDMLLDDHGGWPEEAAFFNLMMLLYTRDGQSYSLAQIRALCTEAGFEPTAHRYVPDGPFSLLLAQVDSGLKR